MAVIPANNNTGLYNTTGSPAVTGNDITVTGNVNANNFNATSQVNAGTTITAQGNITSGGFFIGNGSQLTGIVSSYGNSNVASFLASGTDSSNIITTGNVAGTYFLGNGSQLTGLPATYGNANVATLLASFGSNTISTTGNITGGYILGNGSQLTGLPATFGNANVAAFLASGSDSSNIITTGNVSGTYILGNGSQLTGIVTSYSNANVTTLLANFGSNSISTTGNVTAGYVVGNGSLLTNITAGNISGNVANATYATTAGLASYVTANAQANITSVGTLTSLSVSGNIVGGNVTTAGNVTAGYILTTGVSGNLTGANYVSANYFVGNGSLLTGVGMSGNMSGNVSGINVYSISNLVSLTSNTVSASGNITGAYFLGNGSQLTGITSSYGNSNVSNFLANFGSNTIVTTGNITGGNLLTNTLQGVSGNLTINQASGGNILLSSPIIHTGTGAADSYVYSRGAYPLWLGTNYGVASSYFKVNNAANGNLEANVNGSGTFVITGKTSATGNIVTTANISSNSSTVLNSGKIQGDFSSAVTAGRTIFQTTGTGTTSPTFISAVPGANNTQATAAGVGAFAIADTGNSAYISQLATSTDGRITVTRNGTGSFLPFTIYTSNLERVRTDANGNVGIANTAPVDKLSVTGTGYFSSNVAVGGLLTDNYYYANGTPISFGGTYGNSNVTTLLASLGSNIISSTANITTTGNVSGGNLLGIGSGITGINAFGNIAVSGQTTVSADNTTDTLTLVAGTNITITTDAANNKVTITSTASGGETLSPFLLMGG